MAKVALSLICHAVAWVKKRCLPCPPQPFATCEKWKSWSFPLKALALVRVGPGPHLRNTVELTLVVWM